ncbi:MAG: carboxypeptidase-like regulatory domain-containing protein [Longimicrobiaceae bacterium]
MRRTFLHGTEAWELATGIDPLPGPAKRFRDEHEAERFVRRIAGGDATPLRELLGADAPWLDVRRMEDGEVVARLARDLHAGTVRAALRPPPPPPRTPVGGGSASVVSREMTPRQWEQAARAARPLPPPRPAPAAPAPPDDWIEIELLGEDDAPIAGERYVVALPDGSTREGVTDADGLARLEGIRSGTCRVSFPGLDRDAWVPL